MFDGAAVDCKVIEGVALVMEIDTTDLALVGAPDASPILSRQTAASGVTPKREKGRSRSPPPERYRRTSVTHVMQEKLAETMAGRLLIFKNP